MVRSRLSRSGSLKVGAGVLQLLLERVDFVALRLQLSLLRLELDPQLSEVPLPFIGRCDRLLEGDNRDFGIGGNCRGGGKTAADRQG